MRSDREEAGRDTYRRERAYASAAAAYARVQQHSELPRHLRQEAAECLADGKRLEEGAPGP